MERRFYQNVTIDSKEEAFVILKAQIDAFYGGECEGYLDEAIANCFVSADAFNRGCKVQTDCFLATEEIIKVLDDWMDCDNIAQVSYTEGFNFLDEDAIVDSLYKKLVGSSDLETLYKKDLEIFGDDVSWYKDSDSFLYVLFKKYWDVEK